MNIKPFTSFGSSPQWDMTPWLEELQAWQKIVPIMKPIHQELTTKHCPLTVIFYRKNKPKRRKVKNPKTQIQNINSYGTVCMLNFDSLATIKRMMKHKGFPILIAMVPAIPEEIHDQRHCHRIIRKSFIDLEEIRLKFHLTQSEIDLLQSEYPSKAYGQIKLPF